jgi:PPOX class probable F420-dependent enzyme
VASLADFQTVLASDHFLAVVSTARADGSVQASLVNVGVLDHPVRGEPVVGFVARGNAVKLRHLRRDPRTTVIAHAGWQWAAAEGPAELIGPDDPRADVGAAALVELLRAVFRAAGGTHDDWDTYDRTMAEERRVAVLVTANRVYSNG